MDVSAADCIFRRTGISPNIQNMRLKVLFYAVVAAQISRHCIALFMDPSLADRDFGSPRIEKASLA